MFFKPILVGPLFAHGTLLHNRWQSSTPCREVASGRETSHVRTTAWNAETRKLGIDSRPYARTAALPTEQTDSGDPCPRRTSESRIRGSDGFDMCSRSTRR